MVPLMRPLKSCAMAGLLTASVATSTTHQAMTFLMCFFLRRRIQLSRDYPDVANSKRSTSRTVRSSRVATRFAEGVVSENARLNPLARNTIVDDSDFRIARSQNFGLTP